MLPSGSIDALPEYLTDAQWADCGPLQHALRRLEGQRFLLAVNEWFDARPHWNGSFRLESTMPPEGRRYALGREVFHTDSLVPHLLTHEQTGDVRLLIRAFERAARNGHAALAAEVAEAINACGGQPRATEALLLEASRKHSDLGFDPKRLFAQARAARLSQGLPCPAESGATRPRM